MRANAFSRTLACVVWTAALTATLACRGSAQSKSEMEGLIAEMRAAAAPPPEAIETGTHWARREDFAALAEIGYDFAVVELRPDEPKEWGETFAAAERYGIRLVVHLYPEPFHLDDGRWRITAQGRRFIEMCRRRSGVVKAIMVYNEPYWVDPFTRENDRCGPLSAAELRALRTAIRAIWPEAMIQHDIGDPSGYVPGARFHQWSGCMGERYADQRGVADYVGIWRFPFDSGPVEWERELAQVYRAIRFVREEMGAEPVFGAQAFRCSKCEGEAERFPTREETLRWNCEIRRLGPHSITWYPWRQDLYDDYLSNHPELWNLTVAAPCID